MLRNGCSRCSGITVRDGPEYAPNQQTTIPFGSTSDKSNTYLRNINRDVQLKENSWLKITKEFLVRQTPEEFYDELYSKSPLLRNSETTKKMIEFQKQRGKIHRKINVEIQFLKPCRANSIPDETEKAENTLGSFGEAVMMMVPRFRCDYRVKVFATFFNKKGHEIETMGQRPYALLMNSFSKSRKTVMLPGEKTYIEFVIPDEAKDWYIWVPK